MTSPHQQQQPITTAIPSPTLSLNFADPVQSPVSGSAGAPPPRASAAAGTSPASREPYPRTPSSLRDVCLGLRDRVQAFVDNSDPSADPTVVAARKQVKVSMEVIGEALTRYGPDHLAISYNGGKDCLVLLVLILASLPGWESALADRTGTPFPSTLQALYMISPSPFLEVQSFVAGSAHTYHLDLARYSSSSGSMRSALAEFLEERPKVRAVFVGTRRTDPFAALLRHFDPTDEGWPPCMRVHPVIDWHYAEIWAFIRSLEIPFCKLYDAGYTSLGGMDDTRPNPALAVAGAGSEFKPAYELTQADERERLGRDQKGPLTPAPP